MSAKDTATGKSQSIRITGSTRLTEAEMERMVKEAEKYAEADKKRREEVDKLNNADAICYQAEKTLADHGDKIADDLKKRINTALSETKEAIKKKDASLERFFGRRGPAPGEDIQVTLCGRCRAGHHHQSADPRRRSQGDRARRHATRFSAAPGRQGPTQLRGRGHGNLYIRVNVRVPEKLSAEERKLFERLQAIHRGSRKE
jgi:hypothetical protein